MNHNAGIGNDLLAVLAYRAVPIGEPAHAGGVIAPKIYSRVRTCTSVVWKNYVDVGARRAVDTLSPGSTELKREVNREPHAERQRKRSTIDRDRRYSHRSDGISVDV